MLVLALLATNAHAEAATHLPELYRLQDVIFEPDRWERAMTYYLDAQIQIANGDFGAAIAKLEEAWRLRDGVFKVYDDAFSDYDFYWAMALAGLDQPVAARERLLRAYDFKKSTFGPEAAKTQRMLPLVRELGLDP